MKCTDSFNSIFNFCRQLTTLHSNFYLIGEKINLSTFIFGLLSFVLFFLLQIKINILSLYLFVCFFLINKFIFSATIDNKFHIYLVYFIKFDNKQINTIHIIILQLIVRLQWSVLDKKICKEIGDEERFIARYFILKLFYSFFLSGFISFSFQQINVLVTEKPI
jgi:hypothetical protein